MEWVNFFGSEAKIFWENLVHSSPLVPHICVIELGQHWFRKWLGAEQATSHYLNQCWLIVNWTLGNKLQWNSDKNTKLFIHENAFENIVCEMAAILSRGRWVNTLAAKGLAPCSTRSSVAMVLTVLDNWNFAFHKEMHQLTVAYQSGDVQNIKSTLCFFKQYSMKGVNLNQPRLYHDTGVSDYMFCGKNHIQCLGHMCTPLLLLDLIDSRSLMMC